MKIAAIHLIAFGPFSETRLDLSRGEHGLHLVFGPNEAGKSSALRALTQMLFGIPMRSADNFIHPHAKLRIGGILQRADGLQIEFVRRKGQSKTLRAADDQTVLDEAALQPFIGGIDATLFSRMFAIGHTELIQGGAEIVGGGGDLGQALFAAGSGLMRLRSVQERLVQESEALFKPSGSVPAINRSLAELRDTRKSQKEAMLPAKLWKAHDQALRSAQQRLAVVYAELAQFTQEKNRLERIGAALALVARRTEIRTELSGYQQVPALPAGFSDERRQLETELTIAGSHQGQARDTIAKVGAQIAALAVPDHLLAHAAAIEALQQELGSTLKAAKDRPLLDTRMRILNQEAAARLADIGQGVSPPQSEHLSLPQAVIARIQGLGKTYERLTTQLETLGDSRRKLALWLSSLSRQRAAVERPLDLTALKVALESALGAGSLETPLNEERRAIQAMEQSISDTLRRQTLWNGSCEALDSLQIVANETIDAFDQLLSTAAPRIDQLGAETAAANKELARICTELTALDLSQEVPTEEELSAARVVRDSGWSLIRRRLSGDGPEPGQIEAFVQQMAGSADLIEAFEQSQQCADTIADRLRREADKVNRKGLLIAQQVQYQNAVTGLERQAIEAAAAQVELLARWRQHWLPANIQPLSPKEMRAWAGDMRAIRERLSDLRKRRVRADSQSDTIRHLHSALQAALVQAGRPPTATTGLAELIRHTTAWMADQQQIQARVDALDKELSARTLELDEADARIAAIHQQLSAWKAQWAQAVAPIGLTADADLSVAVTVIDTLQAARAKIEQAEILRQRLDGIDRDAQAFGRQVAALADSLVPELKGQPAPMGAAALNARLTAARQADSQRQTLTEQLERALQALEQTEAALVQGNARLAALCQQAGCASADALPAIETRAFTRERLTTELAEVDKQLRSLSGGAAVDAFAADALSVDPDTLSTALADLARQIEALEAERSQLDQAIGTEQNELRRMDGGARAAQFAEQAEVLLARLECDVEQYARLKLAAAILAGAIEQYRDKNQGPLIQRAGELLAQMSQGSFQAIRAEYDDQGSPVLVGQRPGGELVRVQGMSDGTADQLYLALRLASLEQYIQHNEPLPFIVDDVLMRFDDPRAAATLTALADLSKQTQVIFFTHHRHLVELAQSTPQVAAQLHLHTLNRLGA